MHIRYFLIFLLLSVGLLADTYNRTYNPNTGEVISRSDFIAEYDALGTIINGNIKADNFTAESLTSTNFYGWLRWDD